MISRYMGEQEQLWAAIQAFGSEVPAHELVLYVKELMRCGADPAEVQLTLDGGLDRGNTPMHWAAKHGLVHWIEVFDTLGVDLLAPNRNGFTPACQAAYSGQVDYLQAMQHRGVDLLNIKAAPSQWNLLSVALNCMRSPSQVDALEYILGLGFDPNQEHPGEKRPVHLAAGSASALSLLIEAGADPSLFDIDGESVAHVSARMSGSATLEAREGYASAFLYLVSLGTDIDIPSVRGRTARSYAVASSTLRDAMRSMNAAAAAREALREGMCAFLPIGYGARAQMPRFTLSR